RFAELLDSPENEVRSLSISTPKHPFNISAYPKVFRERFQPEAIFIDTSVRITGAIQHLLNGRSYNLSRFRSQAFAEKLSGLLQAEPFDLIICESLFLLPYLGEMRQHSNARIMVRAHNVEYTIWEGLASEAGFPTSWYLRK